MAASPLQRAAQNQAGLDGQSEEERKLEQIKAQQQQLVARIRTQLQQIPIPEPGESASEAAQKRQLMLKHLAELEKKIEQQNASPRTRFVGPSTKEVAYAEFYDQVRLRIEAHGTKLGRAIKVHPFELLTGYDWQQNLDSILQCPVEKFPDVRLTRDWEVGSHRAQFVV